MKIKLINQIALCILTVVILSSCKKVSDRKLDGEWTAVSGTISEVSIDDSYNDIIDIVFNGTTNTKTHTNLGVTTTEVSGYSEKFSFDKKKGTFTKVFTDVRANQNNTLDYISIFDVDGNLLGSAKIVSTSSSTTSNFSGVYTITGGSAEIKKNSEIVLHLTRMAFVTTGTQIVQLYDFNTSSYVTITDDVYNVDGEKILKNYTSSDTYTGEFDLGIDSFDLPTVMKVTKLTNSEMELEYSTIVNYSSSSSTSESSSGSFNRITKMTYKQ